MNRSFVIIGIVAIIFIVGAFWVFPKYQEYTEISVELAGKEVELQSRAKYFSELALIEQRLESFELELVKLDAAIPSDSSLPSLYDLVQRLSSESGLVLRNISAIEDTTQMVDEMSATTIAVSLNLEGSYEGLKTFLARTQTASRLLDVISVGFDSPLIEPSFQFVVHLNAFSY